MLKLIFLLLVFCGFELYPQSAEYAGKIINTLSSEEYKGRGYCGKADLLSAEFIGNEYRNLGIHALTKNYFQYFNLNVNTFPDVMEVKLKDHFLTPGINYLVDPSSSSLKGHFKILRISKSDLLIPEKLNTFLTSSEGKALLIDLTDSTKLTKEEEETSQNIINTIKYDPRLKNRLTLLFSEKKLTWGVSDWNCRKAIIIINSVGLDMEEFSEIDVSIKATFLKQYRTQNVVGMIKGRTVPDSFLVITAHYDHLGMMGKKTIFPGANDNASGVAMLLNICNYFSKNPPEYSMLFIAFSAEEAGLKGSKYFVDHPLIPTGNIKFLINFDLAGTGQEGIKVVNASVFKTEFEKLKQINSTHNYLSSIQARGEACNSDHCFFYQLKVPCFYIYTLGGIAAYHDVFDKNETLPLIEFEDYYKLMLAFLKSF